MNLNLWSFKYACTILLFLIWYFRLFVFAGYFLCNCVMKLVQVEPIVIRSRDAKKVIRSRDANKFGKTSKKKKKQIFMDNRTLLSNFRDSADDVYKISETQNISQIKEALNETKPVNTVSKVKSNNLSKNERSQESSVLDRWVAIRGGYACTPVFCLTSFSFNSPLTWFISKEITQAGK